MDYVSDHADLPEDGMLAYPYGEQLCFVYSDLAALQGILPVNIYQIKGSGQDAHSIHSSELDTLLKTLDKHQIPLYTPVTTDDGSRSLRRVRSAADLPPAKREGCTLNDSLAKGSIACCGR
jgi:hypothetical protein